MNSFRDCRATSFVDEVFVRLLEFECLPADREAWEQLGSELRTELADDDGFTAALDEPWPVLTRELRFSDPAVGYNRPETARQTVAARSRSRCGCERSEGCVEHEPASRVDDLEGRCVGTQHR